MNKFELRYGIFILLAGLLSQSTLSIEVRSASVRQKLGDAQNSDLVELEVAIALEDHKPSFITSLYEIESADGTKIRELGTVASFAEITWTQSGSELISNIEFQVPLKRYELKPGFHRVAYKIRAFDPKQKLTEGSPTLFVLPTPIYVLYKDNSGTVANLGLEEDYRQALQMRNLRAKEKPASEVTAPHPVRAIFSAIKKLEEDADAKEDDAMNLMASLALQPNTSAAGRVQYKLALRKKHVNQLRTVTFGTNRKALSNEQTPARYRTVGHQLPDKLSFGTCLVSYPGQVHAEGTLEHANFWSLTTNNTFKIEKMTVHGSQEFYDGPHLHKKRTLVYIHGFNNNFEAAIDQAAQLAEDVDYKDQVVAFSWPSYGFVFAYLNDRALIAKAATGLAEFLEGIAKGRGAGNVDIVVHSMGNDVFLHAITLLAGKNIQFKNVIMAAPDVAIADFNRMAPDVVPLAKKVTYYHSTKDVPIWLSKYANLWSERAGAVALYIRGIDTIDVNAVNASSLRHGHGYFAASDMVLKDIELLLKSENADQTPAERQPDRIRPVELPEGTVWSF